MLCAGPITLCEKMLMKLTSSNLGEFCQRLEVIFCSRGNLVLRHKLTENTLIVSCLHNQFSSHFCVYYQLTLFSHLDQFFLDLLYVSPQVYLQTLLLIRFLISVTISFPFTPQVIHFD